MRTFLYALRWLPAAFHHPAILAIGFREGRGDGMTYDDDPTSPRSVAYDVGRTLRRRDA